MPRRAQAWHPLALCSLVLLSALSGCTTLWDDQPPETTPESGEPGPEDPAGAGGTHVHAAAGLPGTLDPAIEYGSPGTSLLAQVYETLVGYDGASTTDLVGRLATGTPSPTNGGTLYEFRLRPGVAFHDGTTLDAQDVKFSLDRMVLLNHPEGPAWIYAPVRGAEAYLASGGTLADRQAYLDAGGVEVVDAATVRIHLAHPDPAFMHRLAFTAGSILSREAVCDHAPRAWSAGTSALACMPPPGETADAWLAGHTAGTGPYQVTRWLPDQLVELGKVAGHWDGQATLEQVTIRKVEDLNTRLALLESGQADSIHVPPDQYGQVEGRPGLQVGTWASWVVDFVGFNQAFCGGPGAAGFEACMSQHGEAAPKGADGEADPLFFADPHMRAAWTYAFDYGAFHQDALSGLGEMLDGPLPAGMVGHDPSAPRPSQDLERARHALAQSAHPDGFTVTLVYNQGDGRREAAARVMAENLRTLASQDPSIQIHVDVVGVDTHQGYLPRQQARALPLLFLGWAPDYGHPDNYLTPFGHSQLGVYPGRLAYANPAVDQALDAARAASTSADALDLYRQAARQLHQDHAYLWLSQVAYVLATCPQEGEIGYHPMIQGHEGIPDLASLQPC